MALCIDIMPSERVRVFISSAQSNENGVAWSDVRRRIKASLEQCIYLNPFIIEDEASITPSLQFFQRQVERADVIVLLVKGEVRTGTATEYSLAAKLKKPLLIYFIDDENPNLDVVKLKKEIQDTDRCTYHQVSSFDNIEATIRNDIMNNIVRAFQDKYFISQLDNEKPISTEIYENATLISSGIPSKTEIDKFGSCYNYFFDLLNLSYFKKDIEQTELHKFGCALLSWLVKGKWEVGDEDIIDFISKCSEVFPNTNWLQKRWDAIRSYFKGHMEIALGFEEQALVIAREAKESDWVINNILIDCRNIEGAIGNLNNRFLINSKYQNELSAQKTTVYLPVLDRYLNNIYELIEKDEFREETATPYTQLMGSSMSNAITDLANYLFTAAIYGSFTHLLLTRRIFANILSRYAKIHDEPSFTFSSLKQYVLAGNAKDFKLFLDSTWDGQYSYIASQADEIWKLADHIPVTYKEAMKLSVFAALGLYLSDDVFKDASEYILGYSDSVSWNNSELYFEALLANLHRMNPEQVICSITPIIAEKRFHLGSKLSHIILYIDLDPVGEQCLQDLANALTVQLSFIISNNGDSQMIAPLVERSMTIFGELETIEGNGLSGLQESLYKINRGIGDWYTVLKNEIDSARVQFTKNSEKGVFHGFAHDPYSMISAIVRKEIDNNEIDNLIINDFIPLSIDVLNSEAAVQTKEPCVACLCEVLSAFTVRNIELPTPVKQALQTVDVEKGTDFFSSSSRKALEIRVLMAQIIAGIVDEKALLRWCIEFGAFEIKEKIVIIDCLEKYLYHKRNDLNTIDSIVVSIVLQCHSENHRDIRKLAVRCLAYLVSSKYHDVAIIELNKAAFDSSDHVRNTLLNICKKDILPAEVSNDLISLLRNDANYYIRHATNE
jgi:hypothetical protein